MHRVIVRWTLVIVALVACASPSNEQNGWCQQNPIPTGNELRAVIFIDANIGVAVGDGGTILRTTDGGATWLVRPSGQFSFFGESSSAMRTREL